MSSGDSASRAGYPLTFRVKVSQAKGVKALWGGAGVLGALTATNAFLLVRVDDRGERIELSKKPTPGTPAAVVATLEPGETFLISIDNAVSITATCARDTFVDCAFVTKS